MVGPEGTRGLAVVLLSGGIDSMACAHFLVSQAFQVEGLFVDYGQSSLEPEESAMASVAAALNIPVQKVSFVSTQVYGAGEIPGRNGLLAMAALATCARATRIIATGIHAGTA